MNRFHDCPDCVTAGRGFVGVLTDPKTRQALQLTDATLFELRQLDVASPPKEFWPPNTKCPDGVLVANTERHGDCVCFVELKGAVDLDEEEFPARAYAQLLAGVEHFAHAIAHGAMHHEVWQSGTDLDVAGVTREHRIFGVVLTQRSGTRARARVVVCHGRIVNLVPLQRSGRRSQVSLTVPEFLDAIGA